MSTAAEQPTKTAKTKTLRAPRKLVTLNPTKKDSFAIGVSADNYHFVTKLAAANNTNRQKVLDDILDDYATSLLRKT